MLSSSVEDSTLKRSKNFLIRFFQKSNFEKRLRKNIEILCHAQHKEHSTSGLKKFMRRLVNVWRCVQKYRIWKKCSMFCENAKNDAKKGYFLSIFFYFLRENLQAKMRFWLKFQSHFSKAEKQFESIWFFPAIDLNDVRTYDLETHRTDQTQHFQHFYHFIFSIWVFAFVFTLKSIKF